MTSLIRYLRRKQRYEPLRRNRSALADQGLIAHAEPGSKTEQLALEVAGWGKRIIHMEEA